MAATTLPTVPILVPPSLRGPAREGRDDLAISRALIGSQISCILLHLRVFFRIIMTLSVVAASRRGANG